MRDKKFPNLQKHKTQILTGFATWVVLLRMSVDLSTLPPSFHKYKVNDKYTTVFVIHGDLKHVGQDAIIRSCQEWFKDKKKNTKPRHNPSTSIQLVAAMLEKSVRDPVRRFPEIRKNTRG